MSLFEDMHKHLVAALDHHIEGINCLMATLRDAVNDKLEGEEMREKVHHSLEHLRELRFLMHSLYDDNDSYFAVKESLTLAEQMIAMGEFRRENGQQAIGKFFDTLKSDLTNYKSSENLKHMAASFIHMGVEPMIYEDDDKDHNHETNPKLS